MTLSLTARSKSSPDDFTSRHEVFVEIEEAHENPFAAAPAIGDSSVDTTTGNPVSASASSSSTLKTVIVMKGLPEKEGQGPFLHKDKPKPTKKDKSTDS